MFAPPDFGGGSPPDASKTRQALMIGGGGFPQGFAAFGCIGLSASGCQPTTESHLHLRSSWPATISAVVTFAQTKHQLQNGYLGHLL